MLRFTLETGAQTQKIGPAASVEIRKGACSGLTRILRNIVEDYWPWDGLFEDVHKALIPTPR